MASLVDTGDRITETHEPTASKRAKMNTGKDKLESSALQTLTAKMPGTAVPSKVVESGERPKRNRKRPSKYLDYIPPAENKPRGEGVSEAENADPNLYTHCIEDFFTDKIVTNMCCCHCSVQQ